MKLFEVPPVTKVEKKPKPKKRVSAFNNRRYKLHQKVKNKVLLFAIKREIILPYDYKSTCKYLQELQNKFEYNLIPEMINPFTINVNNYLIL